MRLRMPGPEKHPKTGVYYLRQRVPANLLPLVKGKRLSLLVADHARTVRVGDAVKVTLGTKDPQVAKVRYREVDTWLQAYWKSVLNGPQRLSHKQSLALAGEAFRIWIAIADDDPKSPKLWQDVLMTNAKAEAGSLYPFIGEAAEASLQQKELRFGSFADCVLQIKGLVVDDESRKQLIDHIAGAMNEAAVINLGKAQGDYSADDSGKRFPDWPSTKARQPISTAQVSLWDLFDHWEREHKQLGGSPASARRWRPVVKSFIDFIGHEDASRVTFDDALAWKDKLINEEVVSPQTFRKVNRAALNAVFNAGTARRLISYNPFRELKAKAAKERRERSLSFTAEEIQQILGTSRSITEESGSHLPLTLSALRWLPWLCAYSGARIGEVAQLQKKDVREIEGYPCFVISPESGQVKDGEYRYVPIHEHLIEQGFLRFVADSGDGPLFYDRNSGRPDPWENASRAVREWVRQKAGVTDPRVSPNHGWRHTFKDVADVVGIPPKYQDMICGHEGRTVGDRYSSLQVPVLAREMARFPRYRV